MIYFCLYHHTFLISEDAPVFTYAFSEQAVHPGSSTSLKCSASGNPLPQVTWLVDGYPIPEAYHIRVGDYVSDERTVNSYVNISSVTVEDGGTYECIAQNGVRAIHHNRRLNVFGPPYIRPMKNITALDGQSVIVHCPVSGYPITKVFWERGMWYLLIDLFVNYLFLPFKYIFFHVK